MFQLHYLLPMLIVCELLALDQPSLARKISGACKERCDENRPRGIKRSFKFKCETAYKSEDDRKKCRMSCTTCPKEVCNPIDTNHFFCPSLQPGDIPLRQLQGQTSYEGVCKNRCESNHDDDFNEYELSCDHRYATDAERNQCKLDCNNCPESCNSGSTIKCQGLKSEIEEEEKRKAEKVEEIKNWEAERAQNEIKLSNARLRFEKTKQDFILGIVVGVILLLGIFAGILWYMHRVNKQTLMEKMQGQVQQGQPEQQKNQSELEDGEASQQSVGSKEETV